MTKRQYILHSPSIPAGYYLDTRPRQAAYRPPDPKLLEYAREQRLKELKMYDILREIVFYCIFLWLLLVMSYTLRPSIGFVLKDQVRTNFIDQGLSYNLSFMEDLKKVRVTSHVFALFFNSYDFFFSCLSSLVLL